MTVNSMLERVDERELVLGGGSAESSASAISWGAIFGGAAVAIAITLVLVLLGSGIGLSSISPWADTGASATTLSVTAVIWLIVVQWLSSGLGGFVTGRLRTKWTRVHTHEIFFRDTAHGLMTWAVATVIGAVFLASALSAAVSGGMQAASTVASGGAQAVAQAGGPATEYYTDSLFRSDRPDASANPAAANAEGARILATQIGGAGLSPTDRTYLARLVVARTGLSQADAEKRVDDVVAQEKAAETKVRQAADSARAAAAKLSIYTALSMLIGAFIACAAAALGGMQRDEADALFLNGDI